MFIKWLIKIKISHMTWLEGHIRFDVFCNMPVIKRFKQLSLVAHVSHFSTQEMELGGPEVQDYLHSIGSLKKQ